MDRAKLLDKIKKCMALGKSPNEHEAAAALRQAQKLIQRHGVTEMELGAIGISRAKVLVPIQTSTKFPRYLNALLQVVKQACGVRPIITSEVRLSDLSYVIYYYGPEHRTVMAEYAHTVLFSAMNKSWTQYLKDRPYLKKERGVRSSYLLGWLEGVRDNVYDYGITEEETSGINMLVKSHYGDINTATLSHTVVYNSILRDGVQSGESFKLLRGMDGQANDAKLLEN